MSAVSCLLSACTHTGKQMMPTDKLVKNRHYIACVDLKAKIDHESRGEHDFKKEAV
jgi:hypothetical protein